MINIGDPPASDFNDPLGVLSDCHRRVEHFLQLLLTVTQQAQGGELAPDQRAALEAGLRYFAEAAPKHTSDEEDSLFPRLRACRHPEVRAALAVVESLHADHLRAEPAHQVVDELGRRWLADGRLPADSVRTLSETLRQLAATYQRHIAIEDTELFPLARRALDTAAVAELGQEMARRRGLRVGSGPR
ncbi:MAG: hemerythrin domain-containing protein [Deltaproteobacteria bacterium]|nr:hemerythrin domain-containing protein [Deltaproteobacteria bacterium]